MASILKNLSEYDLNQLPKKERFQHQHYAIVVSDWNSDVTHAMLNGAVETLLKVGVDEKNITIKHVPGTFELTYACRIIQDSELFSAIIAIGCVIRGETPHFDYICQGVSYGISQLNANGVCPVIFSVLTTENLQQALDRSGGKHGNKGIEAAYTALKMSNL